MSARCLMRVGLCKLIRIGERVPFCSVCGRGDVS